MTKRNLSIWLLGGLSAFGLISATGQAERPASSDLQGDLRLQIVSSVPGKHRNVPAVVWLEALAGTPSLPFTGKENYTLEQKNRTFIPHFQVVPVGSSVNFPNADPFFHNVFSLFNGKRFDLGLYEAGSSKSVTFSREGVSYIFCNIHPEMSAVVISISTPLYAVANANESIALHGIPPGDYKMEIWVEGVPQSILESLSRNIHIQTGTTNLGDLRVPITASDSQHTNMFGHPYDQVPKSPY